MTTEELLGEYKLVLGLEVHLHLNTKTKMFCSCSSDVYEARPNTHTCPVCLGLPGALPVPNLEAVKKTQLLGHAFECRINKNSRFDRKHYFYPDLPKGFQISQYLYPLCENGYVELSSGFAADIERIHLEEDTAKSFHRKNKTLIDFNKSGIPLVEIVTRPVFSSIKDAVEFSKKVQDVVRVLGIGDVDMEKGQMRLEANISLRTSEMERNDELSDYRVEIKNINSFKFMEKAVKAEIKRQRDILENGGTPVQENRGYDESKNETTSQRDKELAHDYRYFSEPDIPPMEFDDEHIAEIESVLPELPHETKDRLMEQYGITEKNANELTFGMGLCLLEKYEEVVAFGADPAKTVNLLINRPEYRDLSKEEFVEKMNAQMDKVSDESELLDAIKEILQENENAVSDYKSGSDNAIMFLVGKGMKKTKGRADPNILKELLVRELNSR